MNFTTIQISKATVKRLQSIRLAKRESYEEIINRLLVLEKERVKK